MLSVYSTRVLIYWHACIGKFIALGYEASIHCCYASSKANTLTLTVHITAIVTGVEKIGSAVALSYWEPNELDMPV